MIYVFDENCKYLNLRRNYHSRVVHLDIIRVFYLPTDTQDSCFKKDIKIYIKTAPTRFGLITIIRERIICALLKLLLLI
jgi:hypothetical protein